MTFKRTVGWFLAIFTILVSTVILGSWVGSWTVPWAMLLRPTVILFALAWALVKFILGR